MKLGFTILLSLYLPIASLCWWDVGHMLSAAIAEYRLELLNPYSASKFRELIESINHLVDNRSRTMIESSCWPDDIKSSKFNMHMWDQWHFINSPFIPDGTFPQINFTKTVINAVNSINQAHKVLTSNIDVNTAERALFARYLVHLIGDIHQPLHSVALYNQTYPNGDAGGNFIKVVLLNGTKNYNLHSFWDSGALRVQNNSYTFPRPLTQDSMNRLKKYASDLISQYGSKVQNLSTVIRPQDWALQSLDVTKNIVYPHVFSTNKVDQQYSDLVYETCKQRITLAGYRMANFIIDIFDPEGKHSLHPYKKMKNFGKGIKWDKISSIQEFYTIKTE